MGKTILLSLSILSLLLPLLAKAADVTFINIRHVYLKPEKPATVHRYAINLASYPTNKAPRVVKHLSRLQTSWTYLATVNIGRNAFDRLVIGNYATLEQARKKLKLVKKWYPGAWINHREKAELNAVRQLVGQKKIKPRKTPKSRKPLKKPSEVKPSGKEFTDLGSKLLDEAEQKFIDGQNARVVVLTNKVFEVGTLAQKQQAMELAGLARERQGKFAQAVKIYRDYLQHYENSEAAGRINARLQGLVTMQDSPKKKLDKDENRKRDAWNVYGSFAQYYRNDVLEESGVPSEEVASLLVSDLNLVARKKTESSSLVVRFDGGLVNDFLDKEDNARVGRALVSYNDNVREFQFTAGRQSHTAKGVLGRFDGLYFRGMSFSSFDYSIYAGSPVYSTYDGVESERLFFGASVNFKPFAQTEMDIYLINQENSDLTDRQAIGSEFQYRHDEGFVFGLIDYDLFYEDLNHISAISNFRLDDQWSVNVTYDFRNSPQLTTINALQGQAVESLEGLKTLFTEDEIYQLAEDRTNKSHHLLVGANRQFDAQRSLYLTLSLTTLDDTPASGGVDDTPSTEDIQLGADYTVYGYFTDRDFTSAGLRLSDTDSATILSFRGRSRIRGGKGLNYDPRIRIDFRDGKVTGVDQWIINPSIKLTYKQSKNLNFEASLGIEHSDYDLPDLNNQTIYDLFLGYVYDF